MKENILMMNKTINRIMDRKMIKVNKIKVRMSKFNHKSNHKSQENHHFQLLESQFNRRNQMEVQAIR